MKLTAGAAVAVVSVSLELPAVVAVVMAAKVCRLDRGDRGEILSEWPALALDSPSLRSLVHEWVL